MYFKVIANPKGVIFWGGTVYNPAVLECGCSWTCSLHI